MASTADPKKKIRNMDSEQAFPLGELITALTKELREAHARAEEEATKFVQVGLSAPKSLQVNGATIELAVQFERNGEGGVSFKVFGIGAEVSGGLRRANTTTMTVHLGTVDNVHNDPWTVAGPPRIVIGERNLDNSRE
jgi:hypothetical protein